MSLPLNKMDQINSNYIAQLQLPIQISIYDISYRISMDVILLMQAITYVKTKYVIYCDFYGC